MPFPIPAFDASRDLLIASMDGRFPNSNTNQFGDIYKRLSVVALGVTDNHFHIRQVHLDIMPDTAEGLELDRHGVIWNVPRKGPVGSAKSVALRVFGTVGATVPVSEPMQHNASGLLFETRSGGLIAATGFLDVDVAADPSTGIATNLEVGQELSFTGAPVGLQANSRIVVELEGGTDQEADGPYRVRVLNRIGQPAAGGNRNDWDQFVLEAAAFVATAYTYPNRNGLGTVDTAALKTGTGTARLLDAPERTTVFDAIAPLRPVTSTNRQLEVTTLPVDVEIRVKEENDPAFVFDWDDAAPPTVLSYVSATRLLTFAAARPGSMAIGDRLVIDDAVGGSTGAESVIESLSGADAVVLVIDLGFAPTAASPVYSGGPLVAPGRAEVQAIFNGLGPANPDSRRYGPWEGNLRLSNLFEAAQTLEGVLDSEILDPLANVEANDPQFPANTSVELLIAGQILFRKDNT